MNKLYFYHNVFEKDFEVYESDKSVLEMIMLIYPAGVPERLELYHNEITEENLILLNTREQIEQAANLFGEFFGVAYPEGPAVPSIWVTVALIAASVAVAIIFKPKIPNFAFRNIQSESANNSLSDRSNQARPLQRIPDIFGTVRSYPDMLSYPLVVFEDSIEYEYSYLCVGRGFYDIDENKIFEGTTPVKSIVDEAVEVYNPYTSPNSGAPVLTIGSEIEMPLYSVIKNNNVNGEELLSSNAGSAVFRDDNDFIFDFNGGTSLGVGFGYWIGNDNVNEQITYFQNNHQVGSYVTLSGFSFSENQFGTHPAFSMDGTYKVSSTTYYAAAPPRAFGVPTSLQRIQWLTFEQPELVNPCWDLNVGDSVIYSSLDKWMVLTSAAENYQTHWFYLDDRDITTICCNYTAEQGLYKDDGRTQYRFDVGIQTFVQQVDFEGNPYGEIYTYTTTVEGSSTSRKRRAATLIQELPFTGRCRVSAKRITPSDVNFDGAVIDTIQWRDLYGLSVVTQEHFGNVTTVYTKTKGVGNALSLEERKLNMIATRKLASWSGSVFSDAPCPVTPENLFPTSSAADILCHVCRDPFIGNCAEAEIDAEQIYDEVEAIMDYFGSEDAAKFCYTFDSTDITFEETAASVAQTVFSTVYRMATKIGLNFERPQNTPTLLFNHRNILPGTMSRKVNFGVDKDYDGVQFQYTSPDDDSTVTIYIKDGVQDEIPVSPYKPDTIGVRNYRQAYWQAWREWNKLQYGHSTVEFEGLPQSELVLQGDKILIADGINAYVQDGDVEAYSALVITTSQPVVFESGEAYTVFFQLPNGSVESKSAIPTSEPNEIMILSAPSIDLVFEDDSLYKTKYMLVKTSDTEPQEFILTSRESKDNSISSLTAINYDERYYQNDPNPLTGIAGYGYNYGRYYGGQYYG